MNGREYKGAATRERAERRPFLMNFKSTAFDDNSGIFEGYVAVFGNLDYNGDIIERGAFKKTLDGLREVKARDSSPMLFPILWQHRQDEPIGYCSDAHEDDQGLFIRGQYDLDTPQGQRAYSGAKKGYLRGLSIGYDTVKSTFDAAKVRHLLEIRLWEGSPVTFPANAAASITQVKGVSGKTDWPLSDRDTAWDSSAAHARLLDWAGGKDDFDPAKFGSVHFWSPDADAKENVSEYKFPFCDIVDGKPQAIWKAITAATGAHGIQAAKDVDVDGIKAKIASYYSKAAKQYDDATIKVPWDNKAMARGLSAEMKNLTGLSALTGMANALDTVADQSEYYVECLAESVGLSLGGASSPAAPQPAVAALLAGVDGLEAAVKAVIMAWQEFSAQTDALLAVLGLPDNDDYLGPDSYLSQLRSAFELKAGRQFSAANMDKLHGAMDGITEHVKNVKSMLNAADSPLKDENNQGDDYGDLIASGQHNTPGKKGSGQEPEHTATTPSTTQQEPELDATTLAEIQSTLLRGKLVSAAWQASAKE